MLVYHTLILCQITASLSFPALKILAETETNDRINQVPFAEEQ